MVYNIPSKQRKNLKKERVIEEKYQKIPKKVINLLKKRRKTDRLLEVYYLLLNSDDWISSDALNKELKYVKRTLQSLLNTLTDLGLLRKTRSLKDTRVTVFKIKDK
ncbi:MAG: hypothetical protein ACTSUV_05670 [Candidatus Ranarchaeia archaeon]